MRKTQRAKQTHQLRRFGKWATITANDWGQNKKAVEGSWLRNTRVWTGIAVVAELVQASVELTANLN